MNSPVNIKQTREQLLQRLSTRRPLYEAIRENLPKGKALHAEMLEPRVLLSADIFAAAEALKDGLDATDTALDQFFNEDLLNTEIPLLVQPIDGEPEAATLNTLLSVDVNLDGSFDDANENGQRDDGEADTLSAWETTLDGYDTDDSGRVSLGEFFTALFVDETKDQLDLIDAGQTTAEANGQFTAALEAITADFNAMMAEAAALEGHLDANGGIVFSIENVLITDAAEGGSLDIDLDFSLQFTRDIPFDLGAGFEDLGFSFTDEMLATTVVSEVSFGFSFGIDGITAGEPEDTTTDPATPAVDPIVDPTQFYAQFDDLQIETRADLDLSTDDVQIGFLGLAASGGATLKTGVQASGSTGKLALTAGTSPASLGVSFSEITGSDFGLNVGVNFSVDRVDATSPMPGFGAPTFSNDDGLYHVRFDASDTDGVLDSARFIGNETDDAGASAGERFDLGLAPSGPVDANGFVEDLQRFNNINPAKFISALGQASDVLAGINDKRVSSIEIPFVEANVGDVLDFADVFSDKWLYDDHDDDDDSTGTAKLLDEQNNPTFKTAQELSRELQRIVGVVDGDVTDGVTFAYGLESDELTLNLVFGGDFVDVETDVKFDFDLDPVANITNTEANLSLTGSGAFELTLGIALGDNVRGSTDAITPATELQASGSSNDELNNAVVAAEQLTITGKPLPSAASYFLSADAKFSVLVSGSTTEVDVVIPAYFYETDSDGVLLQDSDGNFIKEPVRYQRQLIDSINSELNSNGLANIVAEEDGNWFKLTSINGVEFKLLDSDDSETENKQAYAQLGLGAAIASGNRDSGFGDGDSDPFSAENPVLAKANIVTQFDPFDSRLWSGSSQSFVISVNEIDLSVTLKATDTADNTNIRDLVRDINKAISTAIDSSSDSDKAELLYPDPEDATRQLPAIVASSSGSSLIIAEAEGAAITSLSLPFNNQLGALGLKGVESNTSPVEANTDDFIITGSDNVSVGVSLKDVTTIGDLISKVNTLSGTPFYLSINSAGTGLLLQDNTIPAAEPGMLKVESVNGSQAALQLGIFGTDEADGTVDGVIEGAAIAGPTLADRVFLQNTSVTGTLDLIADVTATADFGFAAVTLDGAGALGAEVTLALKNPTDTSGRVTLAELQSNLNFADIGNVVEIGINGTIPDPDDPAKKTYGELSLAVGLDTNVRGLDLLAGKINPEVVLKVNDLGNPFADLGDPNEEGISDSEKESRLQAIADARPDIEVDASDFAGLPILKLSDIGFSEVLDGIIAVNRLPE